MLPEWENATKGGRPVNSFTTKGRRQQTGDSYVIVEQAYVQYIPPTPPPPPQSVSSFAFRRSESPPPPMFGGSTPPNRSWSPPRSTPVRVQATTKRPILFIHGGCLTSSVWESTPDRRPGWAIRASQANHPVYMLDSLESGRSARPPNDPGPFQHRTAKHVWERFRIGPFGSWSDRKTFEGSKFPIEAFDRFLAMQVEARLAAEEAEIQVVLDAVQEIGECDVIGHSHGALVLVKALATHKELRDLIKKVIIVEPGSPVPEAKELRNLKSKLLDLTIVWSDNLDTHGLWTMFATEWEAVLAEAEVVRLPDLGIRGNSHLPMCDRNSDEVFEILLQRL